MIKLISWNVNGLRAHFDTRAYAQLHGKRRRPQKWRLENLGR